MAQTTARKSKPVPRCPVHLAIEMLFVANNRFVDGRAKRKSGSSPTSEQADMLATMEARPGFYKCALAGCYRVQEVPRTANKVVMCPQPRCRRISDAPIYRAANGDHTCNRCRKQKLVRWKRNNPALRARRAAEAAAR